MRPSARTASADFSAPRAPRESSPVTIEPAGGTIASIGAALRSGAVSAVELLEAQLARVERIEPAIRSIVRLDADRARLEAAAADRALRRGESAGPLHGIAITLKDSHEAAGLGASIGVPGELDAPVTTDGTVAARLRAAGAIILGKTNLSSRLYDIQTESELFGRTANPWDPRRTAGGSSGGSAAAVAAGLTLLDVGSDVGGSIRIPASFCGVVGFKPTEGRIPETGHRGSGQPRTHWVMESIGPLAGCVEDAATAFSILAGSDGRDPTVPPVPVLPVVRRDVVTLRIAWTDGFPGEVVQAALRAAVRDAAERLAVAGATVVRALPDIDWEGQRRLRSRLFHLADSAGRRDTDGATVRPYLAALDERAVAITAWEDFLGRWDVLLTPTTNCSAFPHRPMGTSIEIDGATVDYWTPERHVQPFNLIGVPAISIPAGSDADGLPIGLQLVAGRWRDEHLLGVALAIESVVGRPGRVDRVPVP